MKRYVVFLIIILHSLAGLGQTTYFTNPSFEGEPAINRIPEGWTVCNSQSTPDLQPVDVVLAPTDGQSYLGLMMNNASYEDITIELSNPLNPDMVYILTVDLAYAPNKQEEDIIYDKIPRLRISGGGASCVRDEVFAVSQPVTNTEWLRYCFIIKPSREILFLTFEIFADQLQQAYLVMDNMNLELFEISGPGYVCKGSQNQVYRIQDNCAASINATYSGNGATLSLTGSDIIIDFANEATSGNLVVEFSGTNSKINRIDFPIIVDEGLPGSGTILGSSDVCQGQKLEYFEANVSNTSVYNWKYSGRGATINQEGNGVLIDFAANATSGILQLIPENGCGSGTAISHDLTIIPLPANAGLITGDDLVCQGEAVNYHINGISYATEYLWTYTGEGATLNNGSLDLQIEFDENATGGYLSVQGINSCGEGKPSLEFIIFMSELPGEAPAIEGPSNICTEDISFTYQIPLIPQATEYIWDYTGQGLQISGNTNQIQADITGSATDGTLSVRGLNTCGFGKASPSLSIKVSEICDLFVPNAFSPNDDGINDKFVIRNLNTSAQLIVFDRSGKIVFESAEYQNDWDGTGKNNHKLPTDTYWYVITGEAFSKEIKGYVYLKR